MAEDSNADIRQVHTRLLLAAEITERLHPHGTFYTNYVEALRLCAEFEMRLEGLDGFESTDALRARLGSLEALRVRLKCLADKV